MFNHSVIKYLLSNFHVYNFIYYIKVYIAYFTPFLWKSFGFSVHPNLFCKGLLG